MFVFAWAGLGGGEGIALSVAQRLTETHGASAEVLALTGDEGRARELSTEVGVPWHPFPMSWPPTRAGRLASLVGATRALRALRPDVLMPYCSFPNTVCGLVWRGTGAALSVWHQVDVLPAGRVGARLATRAARMTPLLISNSEHGARYLVDAFGVDPARVVAVRQGVDAVPAREDGPAWRARLGIGEDVFTATMVANLHRHKDHATLLRAWRTVVDELAAGGREAVLLLAGRPAGSEDACKAVAYDLGLGSNVRFLGEIDDVAGLVVASDVGVLSSRAEGLSRSVLEYMAFGRPVVGTDIPGIREALGPGCDAELAPAGDAAGLAGALLRLADDPALCASVAARNSARAGSEFDLGRQVDRELEVIAGRLA